MNACRRGRARSSAPLRCLSALVPALLAAVLLSGAPASAADPVPKRVLDARRSVVAIRVPKAEISRKETFRQRWHRLRKEKFAAMKLKDDGTFGAGLVLADGLVLTSRGFLLKSRKLELLTADGRLLDSEVVGEDERHDIALLRPVAPEGEELPKLPGVKLAPVSARPGQRVITLGNVFESMTRDGAVALSRGAITSRFIVVDGKGRYEGEALETDAATNPGAFGGPLLDLEGRVVGLLSSTVGRGRRLGLAIPATQLVEAVKALREGRKTKPWLGLQVAARAKDGVGVPILGVAENSPADGAGITPDERVLAVNGVACADAMELKTAIQRFPSGSTMQVTIRAADGSRRRVQLKPEAVKTSGVKGL